MPPFQTLPIALLYPIDSEPRNVINSAYSQILRINDVTSMCVAVPMFSLMFFMAALRLDQVEAANDARRDILNGDDSDKEEKGNATTSVSK